MHGPFLFKKLSLTKKKYILFLEMTPIHKAMNMVMFSQSLIQIICPLCVFLWGFKKLNSPSHKNQGFLSIKRFFFF